MFFINKGNSSPSFTFELKIEILAKNRNFGQNRDCSQNYFAHKTVIFNSRRHAYFRYRSHGDGG